MRLACWHAHEEDWSLMVVADSTQLSTSSSLSCAPKGKAVPHVVELSHTDAPSPAALYSRTQLYSWRILAAHSHAAALSPHSCTLTALLAAQLNLTQLHYLTQLHSLTAASHVAGLSHTSALSRAELYSLYSLTQLHALSQLHSLT